MQLKIDVNRQILLGCGYNDTSGIPMNPLDLLSNFAILKDYRQDWKVEHKLSDVLLLTVCGVIAGAEGWEEIADFGDEHLE